MDFLWLKKKKACNHNGYRLFGRGDGIRTRDFYVPNVALYQTEPHPDKNYSIVIGRATTAPFGDAERMRS